MKKRFVKIATIAILVVTVITVVKLIIKKTKKAFVYNDDEVTGI